MAQGVKRRVSQSWLRQTPDLPGIQRGFWRLALGTVGYRPGRGRVWVGLPALAASLTVRVPTEPSASQMNVGNWVSEMSPGI